MLQCLSMIIILDYLKRGKKSPFTLAKVMLNIDVSLNDTKFNEYRRTTNFDRLIVQQTALVHDKMKVKDLYQKHFDITKEYFKGPTKLSIYYQGDLIGQKQHGYL